MSDYFLLNETFANRITALMASIATDNYYLFTAKNVNGVDLTDSDSLKNYYLSQNIGVAKKVTTVMPVIRYIPYQLNTVYDMYDDSRDESTVNNYIITKEGSNYYCYRCLDDNGDTESTQQPLYATVLGNSNTVFRTSDGYAWKFLFSATQTDYDNYGSASFFPLTSYAKKTFSSTGKLDIVSVETVGLGYGNYVTGQLTANDIRINGNRAMFAIANSVASNINGFYTGCSFYVTSGSGVGEWRIITDYISNANGNYITLDSNLDTVQNGSAFEIYPRVLVKNNGVEANVRARAIVNSSGNSIQRVEILQSDPNLFNMTASVVANDAVGVLVMSTVRPINSPFGGHGYDLMNELRAKRLAVSVKLSNTEANTIQGNNNYQMIGLIRNPSFANVVVNVSNQISSFATNENVHKVVMTKIGVASMNTTSNTIVFSNFYSTDNLVSQALLLTKSNTFSNTQMLTVGSVVNSTALAMSSNGLFACSAADVYLLTIKANATFTAYNSGSQIAISSLDRGITTGDTLLGETTGAIATVNNTIINDVTKGFGTFIGLRKYRVTSVSGTFIQNEVIRTASGNASFDSYLDDGSNKYIYTFNNKVVFGVGNTVMGGQSLASAVISKVYDSEIIPGTGNILYLENIDNIQRANTTEVFKLYF